MKVFDFTYIKRYKIQIVMSLAIIIGIILISVALYRVFYESVNELKKDNKIFSLNNYFTKYELTVVSNKTTSKYVINEWYEREEKFRFEYKDFLNNNYIIVQNEDKYKIENNNQISRFLSVINNSNNINLYSLSTYISMINDKCFEVKEELSEVTSKYEIFITDILDKEKAEKYDDIMKNSLKISKIVLEFIANKPLKISILSGDKEKIIIDYLEFKQDEKIDKEIFEVI